MNTFLQDNLYAIVLFLLFIILLLVALIGIVLVKILLTNKEAPKTNTSVPIIEKERPILVPVVDSSKKIRTLSEEIVTEKYFCENHPDLPSSGACLICEEVFCEQCLIEHDGLYFCKEHFKTFANNKWKQITDVRTTPNTPEDGLYIYHFKRHIWRDQKVPSFVLTHYKINIEEDFIESFIQLNVVEEKAEDLLADIEKFKTRQFN